MNSHDYKIFLLSTEEPHVGVGGKNTHLVLLEQGFQKLGLNFATIYPDPAFFKGDSILTLFVRAIHYKKFQIFIDPTYRHIYGLYEAIIPLLNKISIDDSIIFHCHDVLTLAMVNQCFPNQKCTKILTMHGYFTQEIFDNSLFEEKLAYKKYYDFCMNIEKIAVNSADHIIAVDSRLKDYIEREFEYGTEKISVFQNATDVDLFHPIKKEEITKLRGKHGINPDDFVVLVPRRLVPKNGVEYAIKAVKMVDANNLKLIIAGDGILRKDLERLSNGDSRIYFLGDVHHDLILEYFQLSDVIIIPSITSNDIQEATSLSMLEGMACGKVLICSDIGGMREVLVKSKAGILVPEKDPNAISEAINSIIKCKYSLELGSIARTYVIENHSYLSYTERLSNLYEMVHYSK